MSGPGEEELRPRVRELLQAVEPPMAPVDAIIRRGRGIRLRRAAMAAGGLGVVAITAAATLLPSPPTPTPQPPPLPATVPASGIAGPDGVFASGTVDGHAWRLAVQDIADPGYRCIPAITVNGTDADLLFPDPGDGADVAIGAAAPGIGFAFVQVPDGIDGLIVNGQESVPAIEVTVCGQHYRLVGLAYRLKHPPRLTAQYAGPGWPKTKRSTEGGSPDWPAVYPLPLISIQPPGVAGPQTYGLWNHVRPVSPKPTRALLASGRAWSIELIFGVAGDCYEFTSPGSPGDPEMSVCGPISTPEGPETIMAMPLSYPPIGLKAPTGYAVQVSPRTAGLEGDRLRRVHPAGDAAGGGRPEVRGVRHRHLTPARPPDLARRHGQGLREHHLAAPVRLHAVPALRLTTTPGFDAGRCGQGLAGLARRARGRRSRAARSSRLR